MGTRVGLGVDGPGRPEAAPAGAQGVRGGDASGRRLAGAAVASGGKDHAEDHHRGEDRKADEGAPEKAPRHHARGSGLGAWDTG